MIRGQRLHFLLFQRGADHDSVKRAFADYLDVMAYHDAEEGAYRIAARGWGAEAIAIIGDDATARSAFEVLGRLRDTAGFLQFTYEALDRLRGLLALRLGLLDDANAYFLAGLAMCERERCPIEAGRCHQGLAEVAQRRGDVARASEHLDAAGELFAKHGAKLYLDQVLAKKEIPRA